MKLKDNTGSNKYGTPQKDSTKKKTTLKGSTNHKKNDVK